MRHLIELKTSSGTFYADPHSIELVQPHIKRGCALDGCIITLTSCQTVHVDEHPRDLAERIDAQIEKLLEIEVELPAGSPIVPIVGEAH